MSEENKNENTEETEENANTEDLTSLGTVMEYAEASEEEQEIMNAFMQEILEDPTEFQLIRDFGVEPLKRREELDDQISKVNKEWNTAISGLSAPLQALASARDKLNIDEMQSMVEKLKKGGVKTKEQAERSFRKLWRAAANVFSKDRDEDVEAIIIMIEDELPAKRAELQDMVSTLVDMSTGLDSVYDNARQLGKMRLEIAEDLGYFIGAGKELIKVYKDDLIPNAETELERKELTSNATRLTMKVRDLTQAHALCLQQAVQLDMVIENLERQYMKLDQLRTVGVSEWKSMLSNAELIGTQLKTVIQMQDMDKFGDEMYDESLAMLIETSKRLDDTMSRGVVTDERLLNGMQETQLMLEERQSTRNKQLKQLEKSIDDNTNASKKFTDAVNNTRQLENKSDSKSDKKNSATSTPANDDEKFVSESEKVRQANKGNQPKKP